MNLKDKIIGIIVRPEETIKEISEKPFIEEAVLIVGITALISGISAYLMTTKFVYDYGDIDPGAMEFMGTYMPVITIISTLIGVIIMWIIASGVIHLISLALGGEGKFTNMLVVYGYAYIPVMFSVVISAILMSFIEPVTISISTTGASGNIMSELTSNPYQQASSIIGIILKLWSIGLVFMGVKFVHGLNNNRALIAAIPLLFLLVSIISLILPDLMVGLFT